MRPLSRDDLHPDLPVSLRGLALPEVRLEASDFDAFFRALHGHAPFPWQGRLARLVVGEGWPRYLKLPTASGKTAALDVAVFHLALEATRLATDHEAPRAARRTFFVVDRRIIVNEAFERMRDVVGDAGTGESEEGRRRGVAAMLNDRLRDESADDTDVLAVAARWLRWLANEGPDHPVALDVVELRGGIHRDDAWVRSPSQPTVIVSTVDQYGSRLLHRGYGVSAGSRPIHAALTSHDALVLLDEAHCSRPFGQTVDNVVSLGAVREGSTPRTGPPLTFVEMTATPPPDVGEGVFELVDELDYADEPGREGPESLAARHGAPKPVALLASKAAGARHAATLAKDLTDCALSLAGRDGKRSWKVGARRVAVVVNRVALARETYRLLRDALADGAPDGAGVELMIGRMRPIDRDVLTRRLQATFRSGGGTLDAPRFVVATQCLEVGADLDFDAMVSQVASLDALRQRFGRLNRLGTARDARGVVVGAAGDVKAGVDDPIYGDSAPATWSWLTEQADDGIVDFGVRAFERRWSEAVRRDPSLGGTLAVAMPNAPTLMPAHMDALVQTNPAPADDPDVSIFLHGPGRPRLEVRVCWRAGLDLKASKHETERRSDGAVDFGPADEAYRQLEALPPSSPECVSLPLVAVRRWLRGEPLKDALGADVEGGTRVGEDDEDGVEGSGVRTGAMVRWAEGRLRVTRLAGADGARSLRADTVLVLPADGGGWNELAHVPDGAVARTASNIDVAEAAARTARARACLRIDERVADGPARAALTRFLHERIDPDGTGTEPTARRCREAVSAALEEDWTRAGEDGAESVLPEHVRDALRSLARGVATVHACGSGRFVLHARRERPTRRAPVGGFEDTAMSAGENASGPIALERHGADVVARLERLLDARPELAPWREDLVVAAHRHDWGKADRRFQARLVGVRPALVALQPRLWAKSAEEERPVRASGDGLPARFRHEALSVRLGDAADRAAGRAGSTLSRHLVRTHHGFSRPLFPVCEDPSAPDVTLRLGNETLRLPAEERRAGPADHAVGGAAVSEFWDSVRTHGWWGVAWLEAQLRLSDWAVSGGSGVGEVGRTGIAPHGTEARRGESRELRLDGLDGTNPLGFLAAIGLLRVVEASERGSVRLRWSFGPAGSWCPTLRLPDGVPDAPEAFVGWLADRLDARPEAHPLVRLSELDEKALRAKPDSAYGKAVREGAGPESLAAWLSATGSDIADPTSNTQLQTARRDYFVGGVRAIVERTSTSDLERTLLRTWDYADPIEKVSLHLEPREDRRHAYQWHKPAGDPTRRVSGGMVGANRLAMEAWPTFPVLPRYAPKTGEYVVQTLGFRSPRGRATRWVYPLWSGWLTGDGVRTALGLVALHRLAIANDGGRGERDASEQARAEAALRARGVVVVRRVKRILVGKTPNFTESASLLEAGG